MTFEEWFEKEFYMNPDDTPLDHPQFATIRGQVIVARMAWEAGYAKGVSEQVQWQGYLDGYGD